MKLVTDNESDLNGYDVRATEPLRGGCGHELHLACRECDREITTERENYLAVLAVILGLLAGMLGGVLFYLWQVTT
jgi:hypothetical protein